MKLKFLILSIFFVFVGNYMTKAQSVKTITGTVISSSDGLPLPGANVLVIGQNTGASTDFDGKFSINVLGNEAELEISYQGFKTVTISLGNQTSIEISLEDDPAELDEVVVIGYGSSKKRDLTGSISSIKSDGSYIGISSFGLINKL